MFASTGIGHDQMLQFPPKSLLPMDRRWKPNIEIAPNCPRCASSNTKFCYYNNYSLSQPRYFCKGCRRYWTKGGSLRNVPVGGGCRKNRRSKSSRQLQSDRVSSSSQDRLNGESSLVDKAGESNGSDIDLAVVFAKFLNQSSSPGKESEVDEAANASSSNVSNSLTPESVENDCANFECRMPCDLISDSDMLLLDVIELPHNVQREEEKMESLVVGEEWNEIELQSLLGEEEVSAQDLFFPDATTPLQNSSTWEPPMTISQLQEFDQQALMPLNDVELNSTTMNMINDYWSSIDLSSFEFFSRP